MAGTAALFRVRGPSGVYYAVYESEKQLLFTEANEKGARDHAAELGLTLLPERQVQHADLMRLTGRDAPARTSQPSHRAQGEVSAPAAIEPLVAQLPKQADIGVAEILSTRSSSSDNPFASATPLSEAQVDAPDNSLNPIDSRTSDILSRDVMNFAQIPRSGRKGNPFADIRKNSNQ
jgi:hypothetical protein